MINLEEHIVEIEGVKFVPLEIAVKAQAEGLDTSLLDSALDMIRQSMVNVNESVNDALKDG